MSEENLIMKIIMRRKRSK